ncbi:retrovirus-related Pol polyprotein from transposon 412 [Trichonephila clavipes]|nr:retrovirus-related Pol polyprotein from transposon 412 [Trichonephila clavipes]
MITNFFIPEFNNHDVQELWFQQDGATCHTARATIDLLKDTFGYVKSLVYADKPQTLDHLEDNFRRVIADIRPQMLENVIENWTSRLDYIRASRGSPMPEIIFKMRDIHPICCKIDGKLPIYYCSLRKVNSFESLCDLIISDKLLETLNKETATHTGIREAEDWFRPIDLAKECDIYISSRSGSHKEIPITYGYTQDPFKNRSQNFKPKIKENYPQYLERENKNCYICGDSSHCARDCEKRFKPKESNDHIHNRINVNTLKIESEKQNSDEFAQLQYVNIFVESQPVTALIDSGCQIPVLNSSLIRVQTPSEEIITLSSCFGEQRMVEVKPINISLNQHSPGLSVRTAISPTLTEEFIIHPSVYSEIKKLGHAKSDVLLSESGSSLGVHFNSNVSFSNVIENSSYDLPHVKNFNTRDDLSSLIKDYKCNKIKSTKLKLSIIREKCSDIVLCKKVNGAMKTSSVNFNTPSPMESNHRRFTMLRKIFQPWQWKRRKKRNRFEQTSRTLERKISMRSTKDQLVKKDVLMPVKHNVFLWNLPDVEEMPSHDGETV